MRKIVLLNKSETGLHLHVQTVMLSGTLMLLLMTANTFMLYSRPASRSEMVHVVVFPGILNSSCTPDTEIREKSKNHINSIICKHYIYFSSCFSVEKKIKAYYYIIYLPPGLLGT